MSDHITPVEIQVAALGERVRGVEAEVDDVKAGHHRIREVLQTKADMEHVTRIEEILMGVRDAVVRLQAVIVVAGALSPIALGLFFWWLNRTFPARP